MKEKKIWLIGEFCGGRKLFNFLPPQTLLKWKMKKVLFSPSTKITEEPKISLPIHSKVDTFLKFMWSQTKNLLRWIFCLLRWEFEGEKHE
ncbi:MAG: hypothetical protein AAF806_16605, partial [Bacteroidota bacterium]